MVKWKIKNSDNINIYNCNNVVILYLEEQGFSCHCSWIFVVIANLYFPLICSLFLHLPHFPFSVFVSFCLFIVWFWNRVSLCSSDWLLIHNLHASVLGMLGLQTCTTIPGLFNFQCGKKKRFAFYYLDMKFTVNFKHHL